MSRELEEVVKSMKEVIDCAKELIEVVDDDSYDIDSFTTQPLREAIMKWEVSNELEKSSHKSS